MSIYEYFLVYAVSVPIFFAVDMLWLGVIASSFYRTQLGELLGPVNWPVAIAFYLIFLVGLMIFAIVPALQAGNIWIAVLTGALFGFFTYATYDLTNWATLKGWPPLLAIVDMMWGTFLASVVSSVTYWVSKTFLLS